MYRIEQIDKNDLEVFDFLAKWDSDPDIKPFITPRMTEAEVPNFSKEELQYFALKNPNKDIYVLYDDDVPVGTYSIDYAFHMLKSSEEKVAWIGILIGNKSYWGKGLSKVMMLHLEEQVKDKGYTHIELGVFDFNEKAINLYASIGYEYLTEIEDFVYFDNEWHKDIRMIKRIC